MTPHPRPEFDPPAAPPHPTMTTAHAIATLADLLPDPAEPINFAALRQDIAKARREFSDEELPADLHRARLAAAATLETAHHANP